MASFLRQIGSPRAIIVFEASARNLSFTGAAEELGVSQPAVSRQIKEFERLLGCRLFRREGSSIELTLAGERLYSATNASLRNISDTIKEIRQNSKKDSIYIRSHFALLSNFVIPMLNDLHVSNLGVSVEVVSSRNDAPLNFDGPGVALLFGEGPWPGYVSKRLHEDRNVLVSAPQTLAQFGNANLDEQLKGLPLLQLSEYIDPTVSWNFWAAELGLDTLSNKGIQYFDEFEIMLQSCKLGNGIMIGCASLLSTAIRNGEIVVLGDISVPAQVGYHIVYDPLFHEDKCFAKLVNFISERAIGYFNDSIDILTEVQN
ncbi:LysR family transcriptional regulator [Ruegeria sp. SCP11]|uniref:LysR family transcriptional regulator n=1 Tax=Ruegeria sp. SCP11 TaxID=3141378 RepID=UPI0033385713